MPKPSIWDDDYAPYGTYDGPVGSPEEWKNGFQSMFENVDEARNFLGKDHPLSVLGLDLGATIDEIKQAFRKLVLKYGPDKQEEDAAMFRKVMAAYQVLIG